MVKHLDHLNMTVADLDLTVRWYADLFDFVIVEAGEWRGHPWKILRSGEALLCLYEHPELDRPGIAQRHGLSHFALRITEADAWLARAGALGVPIKYDGPVAWPHSTAMYVDDPTGYEIEVVAWADDVVRFAG